MSRGWIVLYRKILDWEWYQDANTSRLFIHLLLKANYKPGKWRGEPLSPGQLITGRERLARELGISIQSVRTSLKHLESTGVITTRPTNRYTVITIVNWGGYQHFAEVANQQSNQSVNGQLANNQPAANHIQQSNKDNKARKKRKGGGSPPANRKPHNTIDEQARVVLEHLNAVTGKRFKVTGLIPARLKAGASVEQCKRVIDFKARDTGFEKKYLDHTTPFREGNFDRYLNQALENTIQNHGGNADDGGRTDAWQPDPENRWAREAESACKG